MVLAIDSTLLKGYRYRIAQSDEIDSNRSMMS